MPTAKAANAFKAQEEVLMTVLTAFSLCFDLQENQLTAEAQLATCPNLQPKQV